MASEAEKFAVVWQTIAALIVAVIAGLLGMFVGGLFVAALQSIFTVLRPGIINFWASIAAGTVGVMAAKEACDRLLKHYSQRVIFGLFACYALGSVFVEIFIAPPRWEQISIYAQDATILIVAYKAFWVGEQAGFTP